MTSVLSYDFQTPIGTIRSYISSSRPDGVSVNNETATTAGHEIILQRFELNQQWIPADLDFESSMGWRWFVNRINDNDEQLEIFCLLIDPRTETSWDYSSGEHLDGIEIDNNNYVLNIGTEDSDALFARAVKDDWFPNRFNSKLGMHRTDVWSPTSIIEFGIKTVVPKLRLGERIYFHYLCAYKPLRDHNDEATWFAVDLSKQFLDKELDGK